MSERVTVEELKRVLDTLEQAAEDHASADRTVASDDIGVAVDALERAADTIAALERDLQRAADNIAAYEKNAIASGRAAMERIAALEREAKPVKFRWEASQCFAGQWRVGYIFDGANYEAWLIRADGMPVLVASTPTREGARTALEAEVLKQLRGGE